MKTKLNHRTNFLLIILCLLFYFLFFQSNYYLIKRYELSHVQCKENDNHLISPYQQLENDDFLEINSDSSDSDSSDDDTLENIENNELEIQQNFQEVAQHLQEIELINGESTLNLVNVSDDSSYSLIFTGAAVVIYENNISHNHYIFNADSGELEYIVNIQL